MAVHFAVVVARKAAVHFAGYGVVGNVGGFDGQVVEFDGACLCLCIGVEHVQVIAHHV